MSNVSEITVEVRLLLAILKSLKFHGVKYVKLVIAEVKKFQIA